MPFFADPNEEELMRKWFHKVYYGTFASKPWERTIGATVGIELVEAIQRDYTFEEIKKFHSVWTLSALDPTRRNLDTLVSYLDETERELFFENSYGKSTYYSRHRNEEEEKKVLENQPHKDFIYNRCHNIMISLANRCYNPDTLKKYAKYLVRVEEEWREYLDNEADEAVADNDEDEDDDDDEDDEAVADEAVADEAVADEAVADEAVADEADHDEAIDELARAVESQAVLSPPARVKIPRWYEL